MNKDEAIDIIYEGLVGDNSLPLKLRMKEGLDMDLYYKVKEAFLYLTDHLELSEDIPRKLAYALIDISSGFEFRENWYPEEEMNKIEDAKHELFELAEGLFPELIL